MKELKHITGIILAGGKSTRMGSDKGFVLYNNKPFIKHIIEVLKPLVDDIIIVANNPDYDIFKLKRVNDLIENAGPLAGVYTGLSYSNTNNNLVVSCDVPLINSEILKKLTGHSDENFDVIQIESQGKTMPLIALYKKHCMHVLLNLLQQKERRLRVALDHLSVKTVIIDKKLEIFTTNINTPSNLKEIKL